MIHPESGHNVSLNKCGYIIFTMWVDLALMSHLADVTTTMSLLILVRTPVLNIFRGYNLRRDNFEWMHFVILFETLILV